MVDDQVGALLGYLRDSGLLQRSTVAMLSDHGDGWSGDPADDCNSHGDDFRSPWANRILLGLRAPGLAAGSSGELVRSTDLYPTLLELSGVPHDPTTIDGRSLRLKIPPMTQSGQVFRLKGHGMPKVGKADDRGDLYATVDVQMPTSLSADERAHYEALAELERRKKDSAA